MSVTWTREDDSGRTIEEVEVNIFSDCQQTVTPVVLQVDSVPLQFNNPLLEQRSAESYERENYTNQMNANEDMDICDNEQLSVGFLPYRDIERAPLLSDGGHGRDNGSMTSGDESEHCHKEVIKDEHNAKAKRRLIFAAVVCLFFVVGEVVGGYFAGSLAIMTDAAHMLSDFASFLISLLAIYLAERPATKRMSFGYHRAEVLGALVSVIIIWIMTGILVYAAIHRITNNEFNINTNIMIITAGAGVAVNIVLGRILHQAGHGHSHGSGKNINVRAAFIHVIGDFVQSIGVLIAAYIIRYVPNSQIADPICTFIFSFIVLLTTINILRDTLMVLMEGVPKGLDYNEIKRDLENIDGVITAHSLHLWSLTTTKCALAVHLTIAPSTSNQKVLLEAAKRMREKYNVFHSTIQVEEHQPVISANCKECQGPS